MFQGLAYGLSIESTISLPELVESLAIPDVFVRTAPLAFTPPTLDDSGRCLLTQPDEVWLHQHGVGTFLIRHGREIIFDPAPQAPEVLLRAFVLGPALGALLHQRGLLVLHASGVVCNRGAIAFVGDPGAGKSTMAAALYRQGYPLIADDIVAIETRQDRAMTFAAFPSLKLWPDTISALGDSLDGLPYVNPWLSKRTQRAPVCFPHGALHLAAVYVIAEGGATSIEDLGPQAALVALIRHTYTARLLSPQDASSHLVQCSHLAASVPVRRLTTRRSLASLSDVAAVVARHAQESPT